MKQRILIIITFLLNTLAFAQAPNKMSYQAVIRNNANVLVSNQAIGMQISILQGSPSGTAVYVETQTPTSNTNGLVSVEIGSGTVLSGSFSSINWANGPYYIKTETDPAGGSNYSITGTSELLSVPYALYAAHAGSVNSGNNFTHYIGESYGGGVIFHLWRDAQGAEHGLIVDIIDLSTSQVWSNKDQTLIGVSAQSTWDGWTNSNAIITQPGHFTSAAKLCRYSTRSGYTDWYLPAIDELSLLWHNRFNVNKTLSTIGTATPLPAYAYYWSSTEFATTAAYNFFFASGAVNYGVAKYGSFAVRAIRAF